MPELPEVEVVVRSINDKLVSSKIIEAKLLISNLRRPINPELPKLLARTSILSIKRLAKYILFSLSNNYSLIMHLGMTGRVFVTADPPPVLKHLCLTITLADKQVINFTDTRKFGMIDIVPTTDLANYPYFQRLGLDPLQDIFDQQYLYTICKQKAKTPIKSLLMNNQYLVGIGNIYASEILFKANIHPLRLAGSITEAEQENLTKYIKQILQTAIQTGGSSIKDFIDGSGNKGSFQNYLKIYARTKQPCFICDTLVQKIVLSGRSSFFCPNCQPLTTEL